MTTLYEYTATHEPGFGSPYVVDGSQTPTTGAIPSETLSPGVAGTGGNPPTPATTFQLDGTGATYSYLGGADVTTMVNGKPVTTEVGFFASDDSDSGAIRFFATSPVSGTINPTLNNAESFNATAPCFVAGTRIATPTGGVMVENLKIGDEVMTLGQGVQRIKWIGQRSYDGRFITDSHLILPIRIAAGALADGVPARDLLVSPGHGIFQDGALIPAWRLVNGVTITQARSVAQVAYHHVEFDTHALMLAENCPTESFCDMTLRGQFQNAGEYFERYPGPDLPRQGLPRIEAGFALQAIQNRLAARAGIAARPSASSGPLRGFVDIAGPLTVSGWAQDETAPEEAVCLDILLDGHHVDRVLANHYRADLRAAGLGSGSHAFEARLIVPVTVGTLTVRRSSDGARLGLTLRAAAATANAA